MSPHHRLQQTTLRFLWLLQYSTVDPADERASDRPHCPARLFCLYLFMAEDERMFNREEMTAHDEEETKAALCPSSSVLLPFSCAFMSLSLDIFPPVHYSPPFPLACCFPSFVSLQPSPPPPCVFFQVFQRALLKSHLSPCLWRQIQLGCQGFQPGRKAKLQLRHLNQLPGPDTVC